MAMSSVIDNNDKNNLWSESSVICIAKNMLKLMKDKIYILQTIEGTDLMFVLLCSGANKLQDIKSDEEIRLKYRNPAMHTPTDLKCDATLFIFTFKSYKIICTIKSCIKENISQFNMRKRYTCVLAAMNS